ncbi:MAG: sugar phosphate isomerase/epimerase [Clostridia bacterium]|nr:sugar phosphate isomerase/epimerase [Clostridia bacterium]
MKLATTTEDFCDYALSPAHAVELVGRTPFKFADLTIPHAYMTEDWEKTADGCGEAASRAGVTLVQAHAGDFAADRNGNAAMLPQLERAILTCGRLGIPQVVVHAQWDFGLRYSGGNPENMRAFNEYSLSLYRHLFPVMEKTGVSVLVENSTEANLGDTCYYMTGKELADFIDFAGHPLLAAVWDTGHAISRGNDLYADVTALGHRLLGLHVHDNRGSADEHLPPLMGAGDMDALMAGLRDVGYKGYFTFESFQCPLPDFCRTARIKPDESRPLLLRKLPLDIKLQTEKTLWDIGRFMLEQYGMWEE